MKNKIKAIWNKIDKELSKHETLILWYIILTVMFIFGICAYSLYIAFAMSPYLGVLTFIIEFGILAWFSGD